MVETKKKSKEIIEAEIVEFLNDKSAKVDTNPDDYSCGNIHNTSLVLATSYKDSPRATPLEFFNEGLNIYIFGSPGGKIGNIRKNRKVAAAIYEQPMVHSRIQKSLQIFGQAELITVRDNPELFWEKANKWAQYKVVQSLLSPLIRQQGLEVEDAEELTKRTIEATLLIKIVPHHIILREFHENFYWPTFHWKRGKH